MMKMRNKSRSHIKLLLFLLTVFLQDIRQLHAASAYRNTLNPYLRGRYWGQGVRDPDLYGPEREDKLRLIEKLQDSLSRLSKEDISDYTDNWPASEENDVEDSEQPESSKVESNFRYRVDLDTKGKYELFWDIDPPLEKIYFRLVADVRKWDVLGFGFSDYGEPENADFVVLWTNHRGKHMFQDAHTDSKGHLEADEQQDYSLEGVSVDARGRLIVDFHRLYDTCDDDDYMIDEGTTHMLFFRQRDAVRSLGDLDLSALQPGLQRAQLLKSQLPEPNMPHDTFKFTMNVENVEIPAQETTYWCYVKKLPDMPVKHHIIKYEGAISKSGQGLVHHLEVFHCEVPRHVKIRDFNEPCVTMETRPRGLESCRRVIGAWAMGAQAVSYPDEAGSPIGGPDYSRYVMLEVHYNNPEEVQGVKDSSGITFWVTKELRPYDAGIMELGLEYTDKMALPPGVPLWLLTGYCIPQCTHVGLGEDGIKIFASQLHTHLTGRRVYTKHYRHGVELPELNRDNHYSPHYQEIRKLHRQVTVLPGDALITTCEDTTVDMANVTLGGFSITDEMCVNYVHYYPHVELEVCKSSVPYSSLYAFFDFMNKYQGEPTSTHKGVSDNYKSIHWTPINVELLRTYYETAPISMQCNQSDGNRFPGEWEGVPIPEITFPLPPTARPCLT